MQYGMRQPVASYSEILHKKVAGIPVVYLAGAAVIVLAIVAWKIKPVTPVSDTTPADAAGPTDNGVTDATNPYDGLATNGTVVVQPQVPPQTDTTARFEDNSTWARTGAEWLTKEKGVPGSQAAAALSHYIGGEDNSYQERVWVDLVISEYGQPPDDIAQGGAVGPKPPQRQFTNFPGTHTVTGDSDTNLAAIAQLYYGNADGNHVNLLEFANPSIATNPTLVPGTAVKVPAYTTPKTWTVTSTMTWAQAAAKNGISESQLRNLNNGPAAWRNAPTLNKGQVIVVG